MNEYSKRYFWLKLHKGFFKRHDVKLIRLRHGNDGVMFYLALMCESLDHSGALRFSEQVPYTVEELAYVTEVGIGANEAEAIVQTLLEKGLMVLDEQGTFHMTKVSEMVGSETGMAKYQRERRAKDKGEHGLGLYSNVVLSAEELNTIKQFYPKSWSAYVEKLSMHKKANGKEYKSDAAVLMKWLKEDIGEMEE